MTSLNPQQETTIAEYTGDVVSVSRKTGEYSDESRNGYAAIVTMSSGWTVTVGRYGAVLAEEQLPKAPTAMQVTICGPNLRDQSKGSFHVHAADCADLVKACSARARIPQRLDCRSRLQRRCRAGGLQRHDRS
jgi:hypothetical protein